MKEVLAVGFLLIYKKLFDTVGHQSKTGSLWDS